MQEIEPQLFEGQTVKTRSLKVTGSVEGGIHTDEPLHIDDEIVVIGTVKIDAIEHGVKPKKGLVRIEKGSTLDLFVVSDDTDALDLLQRARAERQAALDSLLGRDPLPFRDDQDDDPDE